MIPRASEAFLGGDRTSCWRVPLSEAIVMEPSAPAELSMCHLSFVQRCLVASSDYGSEKNLSEIPSESESLRNSDRKSSEKPDSDEKCSERNLRNNFRISEFFNNLTNVPKTGHILTVLSR